MLVLFLEEAERMLLLAVVNGRVHRRRRRRGARAGRREGWREDRRLLGCCRREDADSTASAVREAPPTLAVQAVDGTCRLLMAVCVHIGWGVDGERGRRGEVGGGGARYEGGVGRAEQQQHNLIEASPTPGRAGAGRCV